ncbi:acyl transferase domain-containing protein/acyl carrier protein [Allocatelliglobosispora scoriae]|uniref:Acyl transferase domain-containing protein/acyl carrier protein n=1 Tax=Allocatelliglobosispora scoriae TaxID=643052 RepID=A0A841BZD3_9ACTN|nr:SDR family NAD(P)-dependent oxidoreductase [Allocatelliglobosispora scoriae]MBB5873494.1 acyl transferase domain-containing protein/acyl carrier protein [Allocatelliglobosispora scoriae]
MTETDYASAVALVGMAGRFPGAGSVNELWRNVVAGIKGLRELTEEELRAAGVEPGQLADPRYVRVGAPLADLDRFDASVFGINPREAESMNPQHRLFLECSWEALEGAGYCPTEVPGQVAVFAGSGFPDYIVQNIQHLAGEPGGALLMAVGNERDSLASLVSYKLGLRGPAIAVQTFCSTSMVAVHLACQSLLTYECDIALAGGAYIPLPQPTGYIYEQGGITSSDGKVRSFDAEANGTVMGSGVGAVALKRMSDALNDGDIIHAVILGSASNNDGRLRAGYTAPGVEGEAEVIELALGVAGVKAETIGYVECHATGTTLGDSIELAALTRVFTQPREVPCVLGTLKPSIGHLDRASGVTGLMRAALNLKHNVLPATPNYKSPNPALVPALDRFTVLTEHQAWPEGPHPRRAGVNSFGLGGTNAHVVLEQAPLRPERPHRAGPHLLTFSGVTDQALTEVGDNLRAHLAAHPDLDLADVAFTLQVSRGAFALRRAVVVRDQADAVAALADPSRWIDGKTQRRNPKVRLVTADAEVPAQWWTELHGAVAEIQGIEQRPSGPAGSGAALTALSSWLTSIGVRLLHDDSDQSASVEELTVEPGTEATAAQWLLATLGRLWQAGSTIAWPALHRGLGRRVELPTYAFQRRRYWVEGKNKMNVPDVWWSAPTTTARSFDRAQWTLMPTWQLRPRPVADLDEQVRLIGPWLVFSGDHRGEALVQRLAVAGAEVTAVRVGEQFAQDDAGDFTIRADNADDMAQLIRSLMVSPRAIVHGFSLASPQAAPGQDPVAHFDIEQDRGFYSVLALAKELIDDSGAAPRAELVLLTSGATAVVGSDLRHPEHSPLTALAPSLAQENPRLRCRHIDVDEVAADAAGPLAKLATQLLAATVGPHEGPAAVRAGEIWLRRYEPYPIAELGPLEHPIADGETVLITGGLGDVGLVLARHLASKYSAKLVLTAHSPLPPREQWQSFLAAVPAGGERTARHIRSVLDLESRGAEVLALSADVADREQMLAVVQAAIGRFGKIDVVVHGAGVQGSAFFNFAHLIDRASVKAHMDAKVTGFHVLQEVLGDQAPLRRLTMSSVAAVLGGITLGHYAAANAALDAYSRVARAADAGRWITVNWDTWNIDPDRLQGHGPGVTDYAMVPAEAIDIFERALSSGDRVAHLVISTGSLGARLEQWVTGDLYDFDEQDTDNRERHPRPDLSTPFVAAREGTEATLVEIWSRVLGIEPIGTADNFFELGGHSLIAIDLTARIRKQLGTAIPITGLLECPTIGQLAVLIDAAVSGEAAAAEEATDAPA